MNKARAAIPSFMLDNSHLSVDELRKKLTKEGVDVDQFLARVNEIFEKELTKKSKK